MAVISLVGIGLALVMLAAFAWLAIGVARVGRLQRTALERLGRMECPRCGGVVGVEAAAAARDAWHLRTQRAAEHARQNHARLRLDPCWRFHCPACEGSLVFDPSGVELVAPETPPRG